MGLKIEIKTIPHAKQRYETVGDWWYSPDGTWNFAISELGNWRMELAVTVHELVECALCRYKGISQDQVDDFDLAFEALRQPGDVSEPGDDPRAPYHVEHCVATGIERIVICMLGVSWRDYETKINSLFLPVSS